MLASLMHLEDNLFLLINSHHTGFFDAFFSIVTWLGTGWVVTPILLVIAFIKVPKTRLWLFVIISAVGMIASGLINSKIKDITHRPRPPVYYSSTKTDNACPAAPVYAVHVVGEQLKQRSFPSGHTNTAFSAATLAALCFGGWYWLGFLPAAVVGYSRMYMGVHFPLDVFAGGLLGIVVMIIPVLIVKGLILNPRRDHDPQ
jgi:undecaprenyl-diphosphatase